MAEGEQNRDDYTSERAERLTAALKRPRATLPISFDSSEVERLSIRYARNQIANAAASPLLPAPRPAGR